MKTWMALIFSENDGNVWRGTIRGQLGDIDFHIGYR